MDYEVVYLKWLKQYFQYCILVLILTYWVYVFRLLPFYYTSYIYKSYPKFVLIVQEDKKGFKIIILIYYCCKYYVLSQNQSQLLKIFYFNIKISRKIIL